MLTHRTLRSANAALYTTASILVMGAAMYILCTKDTLWQQAVALAGGLITPVWAAYYALLRYTITPESITRRSMFGSTTLHWSNLSTATVHETRNQGTASCTIMLQAGDTTMRISSDQLPLEEVQDLAEELKKNALLH